MPGALHFQPPPVLMAFVWTALFSFLIGLEVHSYLRAGGKDLGFGTTRTYTLIAVLGFALAALDESLRLYAVGLAVLGVFLSVDYWSRQRSGERSLLPNTLALLTFAAGPTALYEPLWLLVLYVVLILLLLGEMPRIRALSNAIPSQEGIPLAKFLIMVGLVLPLLPARRISELIPVTYHEVWLAVVVVSGISYAAYLLQVYFLPGRGATITGILGGLYSSTAATVVLASRARDAGDAVRDIPPGVVLATAMMYVRILVLIALLGGGAMALRLLVPFGVVAGLSVVVAVSMYRKPGPEAGAEEPVSVRHPLGFSTALLFATLFVIFAGLTEVVVQRYGLGGLRLMSFGVGFTDIDPFILSLLAGEYTVSQKAMEGAILIATGSNNLLKAAYALGLSRNRRMRGAAGWLGLTFLLTLVYVGWMGM
ncbi:MAG: MgtC/SapB family protein [Gemmatimonadota bacterium]